MADVEFPDNLSDVKYMSEAHQEAAKALLRAGQAHLFDGWVAGTNSSEKARFFDVIVGVQETYPGGVEAYCENARRLLAESAAEVNPFDGWVPEVPEGFALDYASPQFDEAEATGLATFRDCAFVLVAGGLGERLGYSGIKVSLPTETETDTCYLELYIKQILSRQRASNKLAAASSGGAAGGGAGGAEERIVPLAIMTSGDTHERTVELLEENGYFGAAEGQITIMKQEKVPALLDNDAHIAREEGTKYAIQTKPHGHGDVHTLLASTGLAAKWSRDGRKFIVFFQDTNAMCFKVVTAAVGVSQTNNLACNSLTVPREAGAAVGAISRLKRTASGETITINVEYNQLAPLLKKTVSSDGDVADPKTGLSPFPGNINQLIFAVEPYVRAIKKTGGLVPEFVNPKYANAEKTVFTKPTRLECMMQDFPRTLDAADAVGFTQFEAWTYSPVKNSLDEARKKIASGNAPCCALQGEAEMYLSACKALDSFGCRVAAPAPFTALGITIPMPARVVIDPALEPSRAALAARFPSPSKVRVSQRSTLVLRGDDIVVEELDLDGALEIRAAPGARVTVKKLAVRNAGHSFDLLADDEDAPEALKIRGYRLKRGETEILEFGAGDHVVRR
eukprot:CAMPEP_0203808568 /NCGR_PEP_ID=MMETSP0115-20131106/1694_1 /ASSEMBLY_ACC=CAM_ASM_000227 /TAXON_ID=33651 /ORGANISM="Bicosoecid sp, Strain ms1" /LENGTH=621 /DNA_ID=CAMNT_0050717259 /DNA_START=128 /DNA_END=1993 /DNA_ORIENTATION=+